MPDLQYVFGDLTLDLGRRELRRDQVVIGIQPQVFDLLVYLVENRHRLVSKDDLIAGVWQGRIVSDSTLASRINAARKAVGDSGETQALIRTISRKGVRFVGDVCVQSDAGAPAPTSPVLESGRSHSAIPPSSVGHRPEKAKPWSLRGVFAGGLAAAALALLFYQFGLPLADAPEQPKVMEGKGVSLPATATIAVAVLPFQNLSEDREQEFFSDGVTEEITSALARIPNLRVVARTSAFEFKGKNKDIREIARTLNATHVIEGSVRKLGDQVRVTAQLIEADNGLQVWSDSYDRQVANIIEIQEEIAQAIAGALRVPFGLAPDAILVSNHSTDAESYQQFLRARAFVHQRRGSGQAGAYEGLTEAVTLLEQVVARDPNFAPAWAQLALAYDRMPGFSPGFELASVAEKRRLTDEWLPKAQAAAERAIALDATLADAYSSLGDVMFSRNNLLQAEDVFIKALALDPFAPEALQAYSNFLGGVGRTEEALRMKEQLLSMEPFVVAYHGGVRDLLAASGRTNELIESLKANRSPVDLAFLARIYWAQGLHAEAVDTLMEIPAGGFAEGHVEAAVRILRAQAGKVDSTRNLPQLELRLDFAYVHAGVPERALAPYEDDVAAGISRGNIVTRLWGPTYASVRKTERFKVFARNAGLVEYWRAKGWPEYCRPLGEDDFTCD